MVRRLRTIALVFLVVSGLVLLVFTGYLCAQLWAFEASMARVYAIEPLSTTGVTDPDVVARGRHMVDAIAGCSSRDCHGADLGGGKPVSMGPLGTFAGPNITPAGLLAVYTDGELARLIRHGVKKDGRSAQFMPSAEFNWLPDHDLVAVVSYLRSVPPVERASQPTTFTFLAKLLDRQGMLTIDVARRISEAGIRLAGKPEPTAEFGWFLARGCTGCHGERLSGGPIPGAPPSMPVPPNLTPHSTGLGDWTFSDFEWLLDTGVGKNGKPVDPFMPTETYRLMDKLEQRALWAYLSSLPPRPFGER